MRFKSVLPLAAGVCVLGLATVLVSSSASAGQSSKGALNVNVVNIPTVDLAGSTTVRVLDETTPELTRIILTVPDASASASSTDDWNYTVPAGKVFVIQNASTFSAIEDLNLTEVKIDGVVAAYLSAEPLVNGWRNGNQDLDLQVGPGQEISLTVRRSGSTGAFGFVLILQGYLKPAPPEPTP